MTVILNHVAKWRVPKREELPSKISLSEFSIIILTINYYLTCDSYWGSFGEYIEPHDFPFAPGLFQRRFAALENYLWGGYKERFLNDINNFQVALALRKQTQSKISSLLRTRIRQPTWLLQFTSRLLFIPNKALAWCTGFTWFCSPRWSSGIAWRRIARQWRASGMRRLRHRSEQTSKVEDSHTFLGLLDSVWLQEINTSLEKMFFSKTI